ncbi:hypothetical protein G6F56_006823 [Rhizopus delemar]|nr:hypothetical protein G6F56_006823 [Rhizopus delemar]
MDPAAMQVRADAIILPYIRDAQESSHQRFTVSEMMVKERQHSTFVEAVRFHVVKYSFHADLGNEGNPKQDLLSEPRHVLLAGDGCFLKDGFSSDSKIFTSKFFMTVYEAVFLASRITMEDTCRESMTLLLVAMLHVMLKEVSVVVDGEEAVKENRDFSNFAATSQNSWCLIYSLYMDNVEDEEDAGLIFDDINQDEAFDWEEEVENFIKKLKN